MSEMASVESASLSIAHCSRSDRAYAATGTPK
jgi:hypothetical protein